MRQHAIEGIVQEEKNKEKRKFLDDFVQEFEEERQDFQKKIMKMGEEDVSLHTELLEQAKETTNAVKIL